jgi:hypothetical protein
VLPPLVFVVGCLVVFARSPTVIRHPTFWAEDGVVWFHDAYTSGWFTTLFLPHAGYLQFFPRAVAGVALLLPLGWVPSLFVGAALVVQVLPAVVVVTRRFASLVPDYRVRLLLAALYLVAPNTTEVNVNLTNAQWHLALLAVMVVLATPAAGGWRIFDIAVVVLSGLTGPFAISLMVVAAIMYWVRRQRWTLVLGILATVTGVAEVITLVTSGRADNGVLGITLNRFIDIIGGRIVANTVLGTTTTVSASFIAHLVQYSALFGLIALVVLVLVLRRGPLELKLVNLYAGVILVGSLANPVAAGRSEWHLLAGTPGIRYWYLPVIAFLVDLVWLAGQIRTTRRWGAALGATVLLAVVVLGVRADFRYAAVPAPAWTPQVARFQVLAPHAGFTFKIRPPGWSFTIAKK